MADLVSGSSAATVWLGTVARPVLVRALPTWAGVAILVGVVMGGNGLAPSDAVALASASARALAALAVAWLLLSSAAVRLALDAPGASYLRSLPGGPGHERLAIALVAGAVHLPWAALWLVGGGVATGLAAWAAMTAISLALVVGAGRWRGATTTPVWAGPRRALAAVHLRSVLRRRASSLLAGAGLAALAGAFAGLVIGHEARDARDAVVIAGAVASIGLAAALAAVTAAVTESDRALGWLAAAAACPPALRRGAVAIVLGGIGAGAGSVATAAAAAVVPLGAASLLAVGATHVVIGLGAGLAAVEVGARSRRADRVDGSRIAIGLLAAGVIGLALVGIFHQLGVPAFAVVGAGAAAGGARRP